MNPLVWRLPSLSNILAVLALGVVAGLAAGAHAADAGFPSRPVRILVHNNPGSTPDVIGRLLGKRLADDWKQPVVIENQAGAAGVVAASAVAKPRRLVQAARQNPGKLNYASAGNGSPQHLGSLLDVAQHGLRDPEEILSGRRQLDPPGVAVEQAKAEGVLEVGHQLADGRGGQAHARARRGKATRVGDGAEGLELAQGEAGERHDGDRSGQGRWSGWGRAERDRLDGQGLDCTP